MLRKIEGTVGAYRAVDVRNVQFEIQDSGDLVELSLDQPWIIRNGDHVVVAGEDDGRSGTFYGYAYLNGTAAAMAKYNPRRCARNQEPHTQ